MIFAGTARFVSKDEATHTVVIEGSGKETKGTGTAKGLVTAVLVAEAPDRTRVDVNTELTITGKAAQFGRGVMQDVAGRIIDQFSANLAAMMTAGAAPRRGARPSGRGSAAGAATAAATPPPRCRTDEDASTCSARPAPRCSSAPSRSPSALVVVDRRRSSGSSAASSTPRRYGCPAPPLDRSTPAAPARPLGTLHRVNVALER